MSDSPSLPTPRFDSVDVAAWRAAAGDDVVGRARATADGVPVEPLYPTPYPHPVGRLGRPDARAWKVGGIYGGGTARAVAEALMLDVEFGLEAAWVRLDAETRTGGSFSSEEGMLPGRTGDLAALRTAMGSRTLWLEAGLGSDELEERWANVGGPGGPLYDALGTLARAGGLGRPLSEALPAVLRAVGRRPRTLLLDGTQYHDAGATAIEELGLSFAGLLEMLDTADAAGRDRAEVLRSTVLRICVDGDLFASIAKLRAARWLWYAIARATGIEGEEPHLVARTARRNRTRRDPWVNMLRATVETFAGAVGGADEVIAEPFSAPLGEPRADARRWALGTGTILRDESHLGRVMDPAAGSGYVEDLTRRIASEAWALAARLGSGGGLSGGLGSGVVQGMLADSAARRQQRIDRRRDVLTGLTVFPNLDEREVEVGPAGPRRAPLGLAPAVSVAPMVPIRFGQPFEALADAAEAYRDAHGARPSASIVVHGSTAPLRPRIDFARSVLAVGGFEVTEVNVADLGSEAGARVAMLCAADEDVPEAIEWAVPRLRAAGVNLVAVAARPGAAVDRAAEVDLFVHLGVDVAAALRSMQAAAEVTG